MNPSTGEEIVKPVAVQPPCKNYAKMVLVPHEWDSFGRQLVINMPDERVVLSPDDLVEKAGEREVDGLLAVVAHKMRGCKDEPDIKLDVEKWTWPVRRKVAKLLHENGWTVKETRYGYWQWLFSGHYRLEWRIRPCLEHIASRFTEDSLE